MNDIKLGKILRKYYDSRSKGEKAISVQVFSIHFAKDIICKKTVLESSGLPKSYYTEMCKGIKLTEFSNIKSETKEILNNLLNSI